MRQLIIFLLSTFFQNLFLAALASSAEESWRERSERNGHKFPPPLLQIGVSALNSPGPEKKRKGKGKERGQGKKGFHDGMFLSTICDAVRRCIESNLYNWMPNFISTPRNSYIPLAKGDEIISDIAVHCMSAFFGA